MFSLGKLPKKVLPETLIGIDYLSDKVQEWKCPTSEEFKVFSKKLGLAGTIDKMILHEDYLVSLLDWKQSKEIKMTGTKMKIGTYDLLDCNYYQYVLQLSVYAYILELEYMCKIKDLILVHITKEGCNEIIVPYLKEVVIEMIRIRDSEE